MIQSKKAIGFFVILGFLIFGYLTFTTKDIKPFSDFALLEWQIKLALQGTFHLEYPYLLADPNFHFFPIPDIFFHVHNGLAYSTFPNFYPILVSPFYAGFGSFGIKWAQFVLFFFSIYIFHQIKKDAAATILMLFGSTITIYIFLIHETIVFLFLEIVILYFYQRRWVVISGILSICLVWMRPEMIFSIGLIPLSFPKNRNFISFITVSIFTGIIFSILNQIAFGSYIPIRMVKNSEFLFRPETSLYLFKILLEQIPIFIIFLMYVVSLILKRKQSYQSLVLLLFTCIILFISPNTGGHNTPRYLYGFIPFYVLALRNSEETEKQISKVWILICLSLTIYSSVIVFQQTKELKKIAKYQKNTLEVISSLDSKILVFNNSDFSFVTLPGFMALPFSASEKNLILLRPGFSNKTLIQILSQSNNDSFAFLELPPSQIPLNETIFDVDRIYLGTYRKGTPYQLPNALLPIQKTIYYRQLPE